MLHLASRGGHAPVAGILLQCGADPAARDNMNRTPSQVAVAGGYRGIIQLLSNMELTSVRQVLQPRPRCP